MMALARRGIELLVDIVGEILAFGTILLIAIMYINGNFQFIPTSLVPTLTYVREIAIVFTISLKGLEFALKRSLILTTIYVVIIGTIIVFMFFPQSLPTWMGIINPENLLAIG